MSEPSTAVRVTRLELFGGYLKIGLLGFGGVAPWARRVIVEERRWLDDREYAAILGVGQILPGANTVNAAAMIGDRFQGAAGAVIAVCAILAAPLAILVAAALLYDRFGAQPDVAAALAGVAAAAAGLVIGTGLKMAWKLKPDAIAWITGAAALLAVVVLKVSLVLTVVVLAPAAVLLGGLRRR
jgi:chromate transporter